jgi:hypothetical protein
MMFMWVGKWAGTRSPDHYEYPGKTAQNMWRVPGTRCMTKWFFEVRSRRLEEPISMAFHLSQVLSSDYSMMMVIVCFYKKAYGSTAVSA